MDKQKTKRLHSLDPAEVSLVSRGANRRKFVVVKSKDGGKGQDLLSHVRSFELTEDTKKRVEAVIAKADSEGEGSRLDERAQAALKAVARILAPFVDQLEASDLDGLSDAIGLGGDDDVEDLENDTSGDDANGDVADDESEPEEVQMADDSKMPAKGDIAMDMDAPDGVADGDHKVAMGAAKKAYMAHLATKDYNVKAESSDDTEEDDEKDESSMGKSKPVSKSEVDLGAFSPDQKQQLEAIFKSHSELQSENRELIAKSAKLADELAVERDHRLSKEFVAKAETFKNLSCDRGELAQTFRAFHDRGDTEGLDRLDRILKAADAQADQGAKFGGLFSVAGTSGASAPGSAAQKLEGLVDSRVAKSEGGKTRQQIYAEVLASPEGRQLYEESKTGLMAGRGV